MDTKTVVSKSEIQETLTKYLMENSGVDVSGGIPTDENLLESGILDSLGIAEVTEFMEKEFEIEIDEDEVSSKNYKTILLLVNFCHAKISAGT